MRLDAPRALQCVHATSFDSKRMDIGQSVLESRPPGCSGRVLADGMAGAVVRGLMHHWTYIINFSKPVFDI